MNVHYNLSLTSTSNLRTDALIRLREAPKSLDDLRKELHVRSTTASHSLRELEEDQLIYQDAERNYSLTTIGKIIANGLITCNDTIETLHAFERFWLEHDFSAIPDHLLERVGCLKDSRIISGTPIDVFNAFRTVMTLLKDATKIWLSASVLIPDVELIRELYTGREMHAILTEEVLYPRVEVMGKERLRKALERNLDLRVVRQKLKIGFFTVTDHFMILVPYRSDGTFDWSSDLISYNQTAIDWGRELFDYYAGVTESVDLS